MAKKLNKNRERVSAIQMEVKLDTPSYYVNFVSVSHTPYDFILSVARIPSPLPPEQAEFAKKRQPVPMEPILQLVMPPILIPSLVEALNAQMKNHVKALEALNEANKNGQK